MEDYLTKEITSAQAGTTVTIVAKGDTPVPHHFGYFTLLGDSAHVITFYDGDPAAGGEQIAIKPASTASNTYWFKRPVSKGLYAVVAASYAGNCIVGYK